MSDFDIEIDEPKKIESEISEINPGKKLVTITSILIIFTLVVYLIYTIMFANEYSNTSVITLAGEKTDTLYNATMAVFSNVSNVIFIVGFFTL